jgi:serine phosphatase RsbU (regulator of sigma subunit)
MQRLVGDWKTAFLVVAFLSLAASFVILGVIEDSIAVDRMDELQQRAEATAKRINDMTLNGPLMGAASFVGATDPDIRRLAARQSADNDPAALMRVTQLRKKFDGQDALVTDDQGRISGYSIDTTESGIGKSIAFRPYFQRAMEGIPNVYAAVGTTTNKRGLYFAVPVIGAAGRPSGILAVKIGGETIDTVLTRFATPALLLSPQGVVFAGNRPKWLFQLAGTASPARIAAIRELKQFGETFTNNTAASLPLDIGHERVSLDGLSLGLATAKVSWGDPAGEWTLLLTEDSAAWLSPHRRWGILATSILLLGLLGATLVLFLNARMQRQAARQRLQNSLVQLAQEKAEVERTLVQLNQAHGELNKASRHISDSIRYASRIQTSLLPDSGALEGLVHDMAIHWAPRDVVGGDFYWIGRIGERCVIAVMDCTGHGVPGAFMTAIVASVLDRILSENCHDTPARILNQLNRLIKSALRQEQEGNDTTTDDGLDAAICVIDRAQGTLTFAGANIPLLYVANGDMAEIKGDRHSLGYRSSKTDYAFHNHVIALTPGMTFYLATDGVTDQVGSTRRQLFGRRRLTDSLRPIHHLPAKEQLDHTLVALRDYRGAEPQRDDMTLIVFTPLPPSGEHATTASIVA